MVIQGAAAHLIFGNINVITGGVQQTDRRPVDVSHHGIHDATGKEAHNALPASFGWMETARHHAIVDANLRHYRFRARQGRRNSLEQTGGANKPLKSTALVVIQQLRRHMETHGMGKHFLHKILFNGRRRFYADDACASIFDQFASLPETWMRRGPYLT